MAALPPGPAQPSSHALSGPSSGALARAIATSWLPSSWTPARPSAYGVDGARLAALGEPHGVRRPAPRQRGLLAEHVEEFVGGGAAGPGHERHLGPLVVGLEQILDPGAPAAQRVPQRRDDPSRMRVHDGEMVLGVLVVGRRDLLDPAVEVVLRDLPQHGVDELGPPVAEHDPRQLDGGGHGGVGRDPRPEQLMDAQAQHVEHRRVDLAQRPVDTRGDDRVVRALPAQRPVHQLGGQRRVPPVEVAPSRAPSAAAAAARGSRTRPARPRPAAPRRRACGPGPSGDGGTACRACAADGTAHSRKRCSGSGKRCVYQRTPRG